ncbi:ferritin-like domain-containing protein [Nocardioides plantarum]|uniref:Ferritin-like domain-containing protein n=1 Tax=Nocardioides plantarum TaxID=29299 RepID=A0ABV5KAM3_9ACTN|nr:ferritin-like domain-containing protein [Nocardioides plantarum]
MTYLDALQTTLAGEHAALFVVGYLGAQTSQSRSPQLYATLRESYDGHRDRRDRLEDLVREAGGEPVAAGASYELPQVRSEDPTTIAAAGLAVERACGATYGFLVANATGHGRRWAVAAVVDSGLREIDLGGRPRTFPGR